MKMQDEIETQVNNSISGNPSIKGVIIATHGGKYLYSSQQETFSLTESEFAASTTSLLFLASNMFDKLLNQEVNYTVTWGEEWILLCILTKSITGSVIFDRELAELSGFDELKNIMKNLFVKISAIVETSEIIKENLFVQVKRAIPNALSIAIINNQGMPIKIQSAMEGPKLSAFIYAMHQLTNVILKKKSDYTIIGGEFCSFIIQQIDNDRILGIAVPESDDTKLGKYMAKLHEIMRERE